VFSVVCRLCVCLLSSVGLRWRRAPSGIRSENWPPRDFAPAQVTKNSLTKNPSCAVPHAHTRLFLCSRSRVLLLRSCSVAAVSSVSAKVTPGRVETHTPCRCSAWRCRRPAASDCERNSVYRGHKRVGAGWGEAPRGPAGEKGASRSPRGAERSRFAPAFYPNVQRSTRVIPTDS
jgi:hypothetical protein